VTEEKRFDPDEHYAVEMQPPPAYTHHIRRRFLDVPYANLSLSQKLDIYLPDEGEGPFPVILSIHGGAFMGCDKADMQVLPMLEGLKRLCRRRGELPPELGSYLPGLGAGC
jgi:acetyl esterase/lipase